jgi:hypothetical protein
MGWIRAITAKNLAPVDARLQEVSIAGVAPKRRLDLGASKPRFEGPMVDQMFYEAIDQRPLLDKYFAAIRHDGSYLGAEPLSELQTSPQEIYELSILLFPGQILRIIYSVISIHAATGSQAMQLVRTESQPIERA